MRVLDSELMKSYARMAMDGFNQGWHERNGGNLSYRMKAEEVEELREDFKEGEWRVIGWQKGDESAFPGLAGEYFMVSGSGKYFRNIELDPEANVCIIELNEEGNYYRIVWGLRDGGMPTSELPTHLANLEVLKARDPEMRVVYHCHPGNTIALTFVLPLDSRVFTREIFEMVTECAVVFPEGIGIVPWVICGGRQIGEMTAEIMKKQDVAIYTTAWPCATMLACTLNVELAEKIGRAAASEVKENNIGIWLAPAVNIHRSPLCGRNFEYYSEDPVVAGKTGAAVVKGVQSQNIAATVKHFAFNNKETNRKSSDSRVSERAAREIYLKPFEIIVKEADPWCIMTAYNKVNGIQCSENEELINAVLRDEWGFKGLVMTDWWTCGEHYLEAKAGNDLKMANGYPERVRYAYDKGEITHDELYAAAKNVLDLILKME